MLMFSAFMHAYLLDLSRLKISCRDSYAELIRLFRKYWEKWDSRS